MMPAGCGRQAGPCTIGSVAFCHQPFRSQLASATALSVDLALARWQALPTHAAAPATPFRRPTETLRPRAPAAIAGSLACKVYARSTLPETRQVARGLDQNGRDKTADTDQTAAEPKSLPESLSRVEPDIDDVP